MLRKKELIVLLLLSFGGLATVHVLWFFLMVPWVGVQCVTAVFSDHTHLLFLNQFSVLSTYLLSVYLVVSHYGLQLVQWTTMEMTEIALFVIIFGIG